MEVILSPLGVSALVALAVGALLAAFRPAALSNKIDERLAAYLDAQANRSQVGAGEVHGSFFAVCWRRSPC